MPSMRKYVEESPHQIQALPSHIRDLEDRTYPLTDKLCCCIDGVFAILDEDWNFSSSRRFQNLRELGNCLLQNIGGAYINFCYYYQDWDIERKGDTEMFSKDRSALEKSSIFLKSRTCSCRLGRC